MSYNWRKIYKKTPNPCGWREVDLTELRKGDIFMLFEPDSSIVKDKHGRHKQKAVGHPYFNEERLQFMIESESIE